MGKDGRRMPDLCSKMCLMCLKMAPYKHLMADFVSMLTSRSVAGRKFVLHPKKSICPNY